MFDHLVKGIIGRDDFIVETIKEYGIYDSIERYLTSKDPLR